MITQPLDLQTRLSAPPRDLDVLFWANACAVALLFGVLGSRFVLAPGIPVGVGGEMTLPRSSSATQSATSVVVSYRRDNMVLFEGGIFELQDLRPRMEAYAKNHAGAVLMVRVDKQVSVQGLLDLCDMAKAAGFAQVLLAAEPQAKEQPDPANPLH